MRSEAEIANMMRDVDSLIGPERGQNNGMSPFERTVIKDTLKWVLGDITPLLRR